MKCPVCNMDLKIAERQGIEIDYCPQCRGVWLDRGELDKIIDRVQTTMHDEDRHDYRWERERYDPKRRRRKSFLEKIFDFD